MSKMLGPYCIALTRPAKAEDAKTVRPDPTLRHLLVEKSPPTRVEGSVGKDVVHHSTVLATANNSAQPVDG